MLVTEHNNSQFVFFHNFIAKAVLEAAACGDVDLLKTIIGGNENSKDPLYWATQTDKKGRTPFHIGVISNKLSVVRFIANEIKTNSTIIDATYFDVPDNKGRTPLFSSSALGFFDITKFLIHRGCNIDAKTNGFHPAPGSTPLMAAAEKGHQKCFAALMDSNGDIFAQRSDGADALYLAAREGRKEIIEMIVNTDNIKIVCRDIINRPTYRNRTAIFTAAFHGYLEVGKLLFEHGALLDLQDKDDFTPLILAAHEGHLEFVQWLHRTGGVSIYKTDKFGDTALDTSEINGHVETMKYLTSFVMIDYEHQRESRKVPIFSKTYKFKKICEAHATEFQKMKDISKVITIWKS